MYSYYKIIDYYIIYIPTYKLYLTTLTIILSGKFTLKLSWFDHYSVTRIQVIHIGYMIGHMLYIHNKVDYYNIIVSIGVWRSCVYVIVLCMSYII